jgi:hypothetical protein
MAYVLFIIGLGIGVAVNPVLGFIIVGIAFYLGLKEDNDWIEKGGGGPVGGGPGGAR